MVSPVGSSTGGVQKLQRRGTPPPLSRRKTKRGLREEDTTMRKSRRKEKPLLYTLLIMALVLNSTMAFVLLANRDRLISPPPKTAAEPRASSLSSRPSEVGKDKAIPRVASVRSSVSRRKAEKGPGAVKPAAMASAPAKTERLERKEKIIFLPRPGLYRLRRDTVLVTRKNGTRILIPKGTMVRVAGFTKGDRAFVVSRRGKPEGFIPKTALGVMTEEKQTVAPSPVSSGATRGSASPKAKLVRVAGGPYGGSVAIGRAYIYVSRTGQVSGSVSR